MKTSKLWIWSLIFGLCATVILYIFMNSSDEPQSTIPASTEVTDTAPTNDDNQNEILETSPDTTEEETEFVNEILPISNGKRAMSIEVLEVEGISGFIKPGAHVDVVAILTVPEDAEEGQHAAGTLLIQNTKVLAVGHAADDQESMKRYQLVTLEVSSREGLVLGFSTQYDLYLMLRTKGDDGLDPIHTHVHEDEIHEGVFLK